MEVSVGVRIVLNDAMSKMKKKKMKPPEDEEDEEEEKKRSPRKLYTKNTRSRIVTTLQAKKTRFETLEGAQHLVVPMVMLTEGVHAGSNGPILYLAEEGEKTPEAWNHKPVTLYHPTINGVGVSACSPEIIETYRLGMIFNAEWDGKLKAEAWLNVKKTKKVAPELLAAIEKGEVIELSTGLFTDNEVIDGEWNGEPYTAICRNWRPDHLAILPDSKGACSVEDGAGFNRNEEEEESALQHNEASFGSLSGFLHKALKAEYGRDTYCYIEDIFRGYFVYSESGVMYQQKYTATDTSASLVGNPVEVVRVVSYRTPEGSVVGNSQQTKGQVDAMKKSETVLSIIKNSEGAFSDDDRPMLLKKSETVLNALLSRFVKNEEDEVEENEEENEETESAADQLSRNQQPPVIHVGKKKAAPTVNVEKAFTMEEWMAKAPPGAREMMSNSLRVYNAQKAKLVETILANEKNTFSKEQLAKKDVDELQQLAALIGGPSLKDGEEFTSFEAMAEAFSVNSTKGQIPAGQGLQIPVMKFEPSKK